MNKKEPIFEYLESISEIIPIPLCWLDCNAVYLGMNSAGLKSVNAPSKDYIIGQTPHSFYKNKEISDLLMEHFMSVVTTGISKQTEDKVVDIYGDFIYFYSTKAPLYDSSGNIIGIVNAAIDITAEKKAMIALEEIKTLKHERDLDLIRSEAHKNKIMQEFGVIAAKVAHDISSPLMVANSSLGKLKENRKEDEDLQISLIEQSLQDIKNISGKILTTYREITGKDSKVKLHKVDDGNIKRYVLLSSLLENQIGFKKIEWQSNPCKLEISINDKARNIFAYISPTEFNRSFSNLLNNAYDSLGSDNRNITVELNSNMDSNLCWNDKYKSCHPHGSDDPSVNDKDSNCHPRGGGDPNQNDKVVFILKIKDTGCGIPKNKIANVLSGESSKHEGHGMGLSGAKAYFESISGKLKLKSEVNQGTEVTIKFPVVNDPTWFDRSITYTPDTIIAILDDSSTIIMLWQRVLSDLSLKCNYFMTVDDFMTWYDTQENKENIILFADYDLGNESFTGLDVVSKVKDIRSYLVTNHSEEAWLQEIVKEKSLMLLPKKIIEHLKFNLY